MIKSNSSLRANAPIESHISIEMSHSLAVSMRGLKTNIIANRTTSMMVIARGPCNNTESEEEINSINSKRDQTFARRHIIPQLYLLSSYILLS